MKILISNASDSPLYEQIKEQIKDAILKEELKEGDALPSIRAVLPGRLELAHLFLPAILICSVIQNDGLWSKKCWI